MPTADGNIKGISVPRMWPGHRDYEPASEPTASERRLAELRRSSMEFVERGLSDGWLRDHGGGNYTIVARREREDRKLVAERLRELKERER